MNSNIKKWAVSLSAIALLCGISVLPIVNFDLQASAWEDYELVTSGTDGNFSFSIQDGKATLTDYTGSDAIVTIPEAVGTTTKTTPPQTVLFRSLLWNKPFTTTATLHPLPFRMVLQQLDTTRLPTVTI